MTSNPVADAIDNYFERQFAEERELRVRVAELEAKNANLCDLAVEENGAKEKAERERDAMAEALRAIAGFDDGEQMADDVWDELMDIARAALTPADKREIG